MAPRKNNESASWELDANKPKPDGETRIRRSYAVKELLTRKSPAITKGGNADHILPPPHPPLRPNQFLLQNPPLESTQSMMSSCTPPEPTERRRDSQLETLNEQSLRRRR